MPALIIQLYRHGDTRMTWRVNGGLYAQIYVYSHSSQWYNVQNLKVRFMVGYEILINSGMVGQLVRKEVEMGASPLFMTIDRVPIIQYIVSPTPTGSKFVFRSPKLSFTNNVFILPFHHSVWYCLIILMMVTTLFLILSIFIEYTYILDAATKVQFTNRIISQRTLKLWHTRFNSKLRCSAIVRKNRSITAKDSRCYTGSIWRCCSTRSSRHTTQYNRSHYHRFDIYRLHVSVHKLFGQYCGLITIAIHKDPDTKGFVWITLRNWRWRYSIQSILFLGTMNLPQILTKFRQYGTLNWSLFICIYFIVVLQYI